MPPISTSSVWQLAWNWCQLFVWCTHWHPTRWTVCMRIWHVTLMLQKAITAIELVFKPLCNFCVHINWVWCRPWVQMGFGKRISCLWIPIVPAFLLVVGCHQSVFCSFAPSAEGKFVECDATSFSFLTDWNCLSLTPTQLLQNCVCTLNHGWFIFHQSQFCHGQSQLPFWSFLEQWWLHNHWPLKWPLQLQIEFLDHHSSF